EIAQPHHLAGLVGAHQADVHTALKLTVENSHEADDALINVVPTVKDERTRRLSVTGGWRRYQFDQCLEHLVDADAFLGTGQDRPAGIEPDDLFDLFARVIDVGARQVDLVDHRHNFEAV